MQYKVIYTIADRSVRHAKSEDPQYVMIKGSGGDTEETLCKANFDVYGQNVACTFWSDTDIGDFRCVVLRTGGDDALRLTKVGLKRVYFLYRAIERLRFKRTSQQLINYFKII